MEYKHISGIALLLGYEQAAFMDILTEGWLAPFRIVNEEESARRFSEVLDELGIHDQDCESKNCLLKLILFVENDEIRWKSMNEEDQEMGGGVLLDDYSLWLKTVSIDEFKELLKMNLKSVDGDFGNLKEILDSNFSELFNEIKEALSKNSF